MDQRPLKLMVYDDTCRGEGLLPGLTHSWIAGSLLYRGLGYLDACKPARTWEEALVWLASVEPERRIGEIQFWGHGKWGRVLIDGESLDATALDPAHPHHDALRAIRERLSGPEALWWFRTCETFGAHSGHAFARDWTRFFGCRAAGHTYIIGPYQSGGHVLRPQATPDWSPTEGLAEGDPDAPRKALWSKPGEPNTISCLRVTVPRKW